MMRKELSPSAQKSCEAKMWDNRERNHNAVADTPCGTTTSSDSISVATKSKDYQTTHSVVVICFRGETQIGKLLMYVSIAALHTVAPQ